MSTTQSQAGVIPRALRELFHNLEKQRLSHSHDENDDDDDEEREKTPPYEYEVRVQFLELYGEEIRDLLSASLTRLAIRDGGPSLEPEVIGALEVKVSSAEEALLCLARGTLRRVTGATAMNAESSRSHAIMTVIVEQRTIIKATEETGHPDIESKRSKFHFVDLAGSERQKKSLAVGKRLKEGIDINKGLLVLGNVISALGDPQKRGKTFVPYRDSKLTRLLKGSLGGNHKTLMIACVSPSSSNMEESLNCLRYANRAKNIENNAVVNVDAGSRLVAELRDQVKALAGELLEFQGDKDEGKLFPSGILRSLAKGDDSAGMDLYGGENANQGNVHSNLNNENVIGHRKKESELKRRLKQFNEEKTRFLQTIKQLEGNLASKSDELFAAQAEKEFYRLQMPQNQVDNSSFKPDDKGRYDEIVGSKVSFINRIIGYEQEIAQLKEQVRELKTTPTRNGFHEIFNGDTISSTLADTVTPPISPDGSHERSRRRKLSSQKKRRSPFNRIDTEAKKEQKEIDIIAKRYMKLGHEGDAIMEDEDDDGLQSLESLLDSEEDPEETFRNRQAQMDAHLLQLNKNIEEKEELIAQLHRSQTKYEVSPKSHY